MTVWKVIPIEHDPEVVLDNWEIFEVESALWSDTTRHFAGYDIRGAEGRVSSAITSFDTVTMRGITSSGRVYQLRGRSGLEGEGRYVWRRWCQINEIQKITPVLMDEMRAGEV